MWLLKQSHYNRTKLKLSPLSELYHTWAWLCQEVARVCVCWLTASSAWKSIVGFICQQRSAISLMKSPVNYISRAEQTSCCNAPQRCDQNRKYVSAKSMYPHAIRVGVCEIHIYSFVRWISFWTLLLCITLNSCNSSKSHVFADLGKREHHVKFLGFCFAWKWKNECQVDFKKWPRNIKYPQISTNPP